MFQENGTKKRKLSNLRSDQKNIKQKERFTLNDAMAEINFAVLLISLMFPALFPKIGKVLMKFLKGIVWYIWVIIILTIINLGQAYMIIF